ncbi:MAG: peptidyl-prolyl cis-trans isomerase [Betaproteobacteria bacterium]|nr:peptidyl-prolyl cis-trans isomerase [Betaproteobacteria bacterium]
MEPTPTPPSSPTPDDRAPAPQALPPSQDLPLWRRCVAEPLTHFLVLGALLFALDQLMLGRRGDPMRIEVPESAYVEARTLIGNQAQRPATPAELKVLIDRWVDNEVLYREGLSLGLDKGDAAIRERVIFKALNVAQSGLSLPAYDEDTLRRWFEANRARYDTPVRFDFFEAVVSSDRSEEKLQAFVRSLNGQGQSDTESSLNVFRDRPRQNIEYSYGAEFTQALESAGAGGTWRLLPSNSGLRVVRVEAIKPGTPADYMAIRNQVLQDWKDETLSQLTTRAVRELGRKYRVVRTEETR